MISPERFADQAADLGVCLPESVLSAVARVGAIDTAIRRLSGDPLGTVDVPALDPAHVVRALHRAMHAEARAAGVRGNAVHRLRVAVVAEACRQIRENADNIIADLRTIHDPLAVQLAADAVVLSAVDSPATLATADESTRVRWAAQPALWQRLRAVHGLRFTLAELGYRNRFRDLLGRDLELLTRLVDTPANATRTQLTEYFELAEQQQWAAVLRAGCRLWLPTLTEQAQRIEKLREIWQATRRAESHARQ